MGKITKVFDKIADALVPKEIAPFLGPAAMAFAGPLTMPIALGIGQLGAAKMMSGKLDPYTALGTALSAQGFKASNPERYGSVKRGLGTFFESGDFMSGFNTPSGLPIANVTPTNPKTFEEITPEYLNELQDTPSKNMFERGVGKLDKLTQSIGDVIFPGFFDGDEFNFTKALTTIGSVTTLSALAPMAEELKKQKLKDKEEEGKLFKEWFDSYKRVSGRDYINSPFPDPILEEKYKEFMMAEGGRVGYNMGGGIMDAAPGVPPGMELDYRDSGGFIPMGSQEKKDDVPAVLAKNEFVLTSDAMSGLDKMMGGSGDPRAAAKHMYQMMDQLEAMA